MNQLFWYYDNIPVLSPEHTDFDRKMEAAQLYPRLQLLVERALDCFDKEPQKVKFLCVLNEVCIFSRIFRHRRDVQDFLETQFVGGSLRYHSLALRRQGVDYSFFYPKTLRLFSLLAELASMLDVHLNPLDKNVQFEMFWDNEKITFGDHRSH